MGGYREHSFDPNAGGEYGPPLRPFNKWQGLGVGVGVLGALVIAAEIASRVGWFPLKHDTVLAGTSLLLVGSMLVNSRRQPGGLTSETSRKRMVIVAVALMVLGAALLTIFVLKGAGS
ncbi:MAG TPA: hypothetical protein VFW35_03060 [Sphingomicrobium sp.]|nr:hypothetical protein [Sphingomicrobium sp.]